MVIAMGADKHNSDLPGLAGLTAAGFMLAIGTLTNPASAQTCQELERKLASMPAGVHVLPAHANDEAGSMAAQRRYLIRLEGTIGQVGCSIRTVGQDDHCAQLHGERQAAQAELAEMEARQIAITSQRSEIFDKMREAGCAQAASFRQTVASATRAQGSFVHLGDSPPAPDRPAGQSSFSVVGGSYRTPEIEIPTDDEATKEASRHEDSVAPGTFAAPADADIARTTISEQADEPISPSVEAVPALLERRIRVVGPRFLPDPEEAIDLQAQGRDRAR